MELPSMVRKMILLYSKETLQDTFNYDPVLNTVDSLFKVIIPQMFIRHLPLNVNKISSLEKWIDLEVTHFKA